MPTIPLTLDSFSPTSQQLLGRLDVAKRFDSGFDSAIEAAGQFVEAIAQSMCSGQPPEACAKCTAAGVFFARLEDVGTPEEWAKFMADMGGLARARLIAMMRTPVVPNACPNSRP